MSVATTMSKIDVIDALVTIENILGIYRNYSVLSREAKIFVKIRTFLETSIMSIFTVYLLYYYAVIFPSTYFNRVIVIYYTIFRSMNSFVAIFLSLYSFKYFDEFILLVRNTRVKYGNNLLYQMFVSKENKKYLVDIVLFSVIMIFTTFIYSYNLYLLKVKKLFILEFALKIVHYYRYFYGNFIFSQYIDIFIGPIKYFNYLLSNVLNKLKADQEIVEKRELETLHEDLETLGKIYQLLQATSASLQNCFGIQVSTKNCYLQQVLQSINQSNELIPAI